MQKEVEVSVFLERFNQFIQPHHCHFHKKNPTFVCIDKNCLKRGLICSTCLTINGEHKNHDSIEIGEFMEQIFEKFANIIKKGSTGELIKKIDQAYEQLLRILTDFHEDFSNTIKQYISDKNQLHTKKQTELFAENSFVNFKLCKFNSLSDMNSSIQLLISQTLYDQQEQSTKSNYAKLQESQYYLTSIQEQTIQIKYYLSKMLKQLNSSLRKQSKPIFSHPQLIQTNQYLYLGSVLGSNPEGTGVRYSKEDKSICYGTFQGGYIEGVGQLYTHNGDYYVGQFKDDKKHGLGTYIWLHDKSQYIGQFINGKRNGRGVFKWIDGSQYSGQFYNGQQQGYGILYRQGSSIEYEGEWRNGMFHGKGVQYFDNGESFRGTFKDDQFHGEGILYKSDSTVTGIWKDNELTAVNMVRSILTEK